MTDGQFPPPPGAGVIETERGADGREVFLSICIPTYNRAAKLGRRFEQFARILGASPYRGRVEIVVSDNGSTDPTAATLAEWADRVGALCPARFYTQTRNLGAEGNFKFLYEQARGEYVWICSDDDILFEDQFDPLVADLLEHRPEVCISSFLQPPWTPESRVFMCGGERTQTVTDVREAVPAFMTFAKLTPFVYRRRVLRPHEAAAAEQSAATTAYWFITLSVLLFVSYERKLLLRTANVARSDDDFHQLRFSVRVYPTVREAALLGLGNDPSAPYFRETLPVLDATSNVVGLLFRYATGFGNMDRGVARDDFRYVKENLGTIARSGWRNLVKLPVVLLMVPVAHRLPWSRAR